MYKILELGFFRFRSSFWKLRVVVWALHKTNPASNRVKRQTSRVMDGGALRSVAGGGSLPAVTTPPCPPQDPAGPRGPAARRSPRDASAPMVHWPEPEQKTDSRRGGLRLSRPPGRSSRARTGAGPHACASCLGQAQKEAKNRLLRMLAHVGEMCTTGAQYEVQVQVEMSRKCYKVTVTHRAEAGHAQTWNKYTAACNT